MLRLLWVVIGLAVGAALLQGDASFLPHSWQPHRDLIAAVVLALLLMPVITAGRR